MSNGYATSTSSTLLPRRGFNAAKLRARGSGEGPPVASARGYLRGNLPAIYQDGDFGLRFLEALETSLDPIVGTLDALAAYFHPTLAPRDVLELLASWFGLTVEESWPDERLRKALALEGELSRRRGTRAGLELALEIAFPTLPLRVEDGGGVTVSSAPAGGENAPPAGERAWQGGFVVYCDTPIPEQTQHAVARVIERSKPVHVGYRLRIKAAKRQPA